jgi:hypothetical protein
MKLTVVTSSLLGTDIAPSTLFSQTVVTLAVTEHVEVVPALAHSMLKLQHVLGMQYACGCIPTLQQHLNVCFVLCSSQSE